MRYTRVPESSPDMAPRSRRLLVDTGPIDSLLPYLEPILQSTIGDFTINLAETAKGNSPPVYEIFSRATQQPPRLTVITNARPGRLGRVAAHMLRGSRTNVLLGPAVPLYENVIPGDMVLPSKATVLTPKRHQPRTFEPVPPSQKEDLRAKSLAIVERHIGSYWQGGVALKGQNPPDEEKVHAVADDGTTADFFRLSNQLEAPSVALLTVAPEHGGEQPPAHERQQICQAAVGILFTSERQASILL